ncbi:hypothetical protein [Glutamicibacter sp. V16R2B1]|uniref:hypothetical protein n=1 Tax=Glutamicibacter sp. V16R2B1 TaxID=2036207 RepID=UPI0010FEBF77|nr:hypothetical protein [Glutamicibacter sp. V16R2B1]TLK51947.1 hypothetical protein FDN03_09220 [Glutamicibacter sp. V16R2B1]
MKRKPGYDTLMYFWFAMVLVVVAIAVHLVGLSFLTNGEEPNLQALAIVGMVSAGCYVVAGIFGLVVVHKCIAMLVYLVHHKP